MTRRLLSSALLGLLLGACGTTPTHRPDGPPRRGVDLGAIPDAIPRAEPRSRYGNPPAYTVFGKTYHVLDSSRGYVERGIASWYGRKFHGRRTSSGEPYDMLAMTAAHKTLPLPTYARVTRLDTGQSIIVRINDRGPFHDDRIIDLSYAAAARLGMQHSGTAPVEVRAIDPETDTPTAEAKAERAIGDTATAALQPVAGAMPVSRPTLADIPQPRHHAEPEPLQDFGTAPVDAQRPAASHANVYLQLGAFSRRENAERLLSRLQDLASPLEIQADHSRQTTVYRLRLGPLADVETANALAPGLLPRLDELGLGRPRIVID